MGILLQFAGLFMKDEQETEQLLRFLQPLPEVMCYGNYQISHYGFQLQDEGHTGHMEPRTSLSARFTPL